MKRNCVWGESMKITSEAWRNLFKNPPEDETKKYIFLVEDEKMAERILDAGYLAKGISNEAEKIAFLALLEECMFSWVADYRFVLNSKFGIIGSVKRDLEAIGCTAFPDGYKIFKNRESRFLEYIEELRDALCQYVKGMEKKPSSGDYSVVSLADVEEKEMDWLVTDYIPKGQITTLAGSGGCGKTSIWCDIAASVSNGNPSFLIKKLFSDGFEGEEPRTVMCFSAEDSLEHVLKARLRKSGANLENIISIDIGDDRFGEIRFNSEFLGKLIEKYRPALVIFDPIQAFIPPEMKMSERNAMRNCMRPLIGYGEKYGCTFLIVVHTNKQSGVWGRKRIADSSDIWDISRSVLLVGETKDKRIRYLSQEKNNYAVEAKSVLFSIEDGNIEFKGYSEKKDQDFILEQSHRIRTSHKREEAEEFILNFLGDETRRIADLDSAAVAAGISKKTLERAKSELKSEGKIQVSQEGNARGGKEKIWYVRVCDPLYS